MGSAEWENAQRSRGAGGRGETGEPSVRRLARRSSSANVLTERRGRCVVDGMDSGQCIAQSSIIKKIEIFARFDVCTFPVIDGILKGK